jgi:hypothetical protein
MVTIAQEPGGAFDFGGFGGFKIPVPEGFGGLPGAAPAFRTSAQLTGMQMPGAFGVLTLVAAIIGAAVALLGAFVPDRTVLKASLWTAFATGLMGLFLGLLAALLTTSESAEHWFGKTGGTEKGAWGAWVASAAGFAAALMFLLTLLTMSGDRRTPAPAQRAAAL